MLGKLSKLDLKSEPFDSSEFAGNLDTLIREYAYNKEIAELIRKGKNYVDECKRPIKKAIKDYLTMDGTIDASKLKDDWFPKLQNKHVFLSHSHKDEELAKGVAASLQEKGVSVFIDSLVWNYCDELIRQMDKNYCKTGDGHYDYRLRNYTTSHVHNMLGVALMKMMDRCECVIFLNTDNATAEKPLQCGAEHSKQILSYTHSPWIYHEIQMIKYIQKKIPERLICKPLLEQGQFTLEKSITKLPYFDYTVNLNDMAVLTLKELKDLKCDEDGRALDQLYRTDSSMEYIRTHYADTWSGQLCLSSEEL